MADENLAPDEREAVLKLLRDTIAADKYPLSPRIRILRSALAKLDPEPPAASEPYPPANGMDQQQRRSPVACGSVKCSR